MQELVVQEKIENLIYEVRGKQVMLDSDLAKLYQCKNGTKEINQAVKRNPMKFPSDFCFQLTIEEFDNLWSQFVTTKEKKYDKNFTLCIYRTRSCHDSNHFENNDCY